MRVVTSNCCLMFSLYAIIFRYYLLTRLVESAQLVEASTSSSYNSSTTIDHHEFSSPNTSIHNNPQVQVNEPQSLIQVVPKNHRMDAEQPEASQIQHLNASPETGNRTDGFQVNLESFFGRENNHHQGSSYNGFPSWWFLSDQQHPSSKQQVYTNSENTVALDMHNQPNKQWSVAYNPEPTIGEVTNGKISGSSSSYGGFELTAPNSTMPKFSLANVQLEAHRKLGSSQQVANEPAVSFDDDDVDDSISDSTVYSSIHDLNAFNGESKIRDVDPKVLPNFKLGRNSQSAGVSLQDARNALEENLALQNKLLVLLNRPKIFPKQRNAPKNNLLLSNHQGQIHYHQQQQGLHGTQTRRGDRQVAFETEKTANVTSPIGYYENPRRRIVYKRKFRKKISTLPAQSVGLAKSLSDTGDWLPASSISGIPTSSGLYGPSVPKSSDNVTTQERYQPPLSPYNNQLQATIPIDDIVSMTDVTSRQALAYPMQTIRYSTIEEPNKTHRLSNWQVSKKLPVVSGRKKSHYPLDEPGQLDNFYRRQRQVDASNQFIDENLPVEVKSGSNDLEYMDLSRKMIGQGPPLSLYSTFYSDSDDTTQGYDQQQDTQGLSKGSQHQHQQFQDPDDEQQQQPMDDNSDWSWPITQQTNGQRMQLHPASGTSGRSGPTMSSSVSNKKRNAHKAFGSSGTINRHKIGANRPAYYRSPPMNKLINQRHMFHQEPYLANHIDTYSNPMTSGSAPSLAKYDDLGGGVSEFRDMSSPAHQVVHIHSKERKGYGKYLWPIVGGGLTMLMGFLIISNILLSIPLLAIGASTLFNSQQGGFHSQQLVPVYNLSQIMPPARPSGSSGRRRKKRWARSRGGQTGKPSPGDGGRRRVAGDSGTTNADSGDGMRLERELELEARLERLIDQIVTSSGVSRLLKKAGGLFGKSGLTRKQVLKAAYCHKPINFKQQIVL